VASFIEEDGTVTEKKESKEEEEKEKSKEDPIKEEPHDPNVITLPSLTADLKNHLVMAAGNQRTAMIRN